MKSQKIFISYADEDRQFVALIAKLLEVHNHRPWFAQAKLRGGELFAKKIDEELVASDVLLVLVSSNGKDSTWMTTEIATFKTAHPGAPVIPIMLEKVDPDSIFPGLKNHQWIDFSKCLLTGMTELFSSLGNDFLSRHELMNRRTGVDRRSGQDRRQSSIRQRVSVGMLVSYTRLTGKDVADLTVLSPTDVKVLKGPARAELERYEFTDSASGQAVTPEEVLEQAFREARVLMKCSDISDAVGILRIMTDYVCDRYEVRMKDRRKDRRRQADRIEATV